MGDDMRAYCDACGYRSKPQTSIKKVNSLLEQHRRGSKHRALVPENDEAAYSGIVGAPPQVGGEPVDEETDRRRRQKMVDVRKRLGTRTDDIDASLRRRERAIIDES